MIGIANGPSKLSNFRSSMTFFILNNYYDRFLTRKYHRLTKDCILFTYSSISLSSNKLILTVFLIYPPGLSVATYTFT